MSKMSATSAPAPNAESMPIKMPLVVELFDCVWMRIICSAAMLILDEERGEAMPLGCVGLLSVEGGARSVG